MVPQTRYSKNGSVSIAYQVLGEGPTDLIYVPGWVSNIEIFWEDPAYTRFLNRLASFSRLILFDKQGTGLSDRVAEIPGLEVRMDDVRAVLDSVGSERTRLKSAAMAFGWLLPGEPGPMPIAAAASLASSTSFDASASALLTCLRTLISAPKS